MRDHRTRKGKKLVVNIAATCDLLEPRRLLASVWYVDQAIGSDSYNGATWIANAGAKTGPFKTISAAAAKAKAGDIVDINSGVYHETITPAFSGTSAAPISYQAYNSSASVTIDGADPVTGWSSYSGNIYQAPMNWTMGNQDDQVFVDGQMMTYARWPNTSLDVSRPTFNLAGNGSTGVMNGTTLVNTLVDPNLTQPNGYWTGATIHVQSGPTWIYETATITNYSTGVITYNSSYGNIAFIATQGDPYYITGKFQSLDSADEYYRDSSTKTLYLWTPNGDSPALHNVEAKARQWAFNLSGRSYINITGVNFFAAGVYTNASNFITINGIKASYVAHFQTWNGNWGAHAVDNGIILNGSNNTFENSEIAFSAGNGISLVSGNNDVIANNYIHDVDYMGLDDGAVANSDNYPSSNVNISNNTFADSGRALVLSRSLISSRVSGNRLFNAMLQTTDGGAFYTWNNTDNGTRVDHNVISDAFNYVSGNAACGIMLDGSSSGFTIDHNVVYNATNGIKANNASGNNYYDNTVTSSAGGFEIYGSNASGSVINNITTANNTFPTSGMTISNNVLPPVDPLFVNPGAANYQLSSSSTAIDAGMVITPYTNGYTGSAPDIGALEYNSSSWLAGANNAYTSQIPGSPTGLVLSVASSTQVNLSWTDNTSNATSYIIERSSDGSDFVQIGTASGTATGYSDTGLPLGTYTYRVRAMNGSLDSSYTPYATIRTGRNAYLPQQAVSLDAQNGGLNVGTSSVGSFDNHDWAVYQGVDFGAYSAGLFIMNLAVPASNAGQQIQIRLDSTTGQLIGTLMPTATGGYGNYQEESTQVTPVTGKHDIYLYGIGSAGICNFSYFYFFVTSYSGGVGADTYAVRASPSGGFQTQVFVNVPETASPTFAIATTLLPSLSFSTGLDGLLTIDYSNGNPLPAGLTSFTGGAELLIHGANAGGGSFTINGSSILNTAVPAARITDTGVGEIEFDLPGGSSTLTQLAQPGAGVIFNASGTNNTLNISAGTFTFTSDPQAQGGSLDLIDNSTVVFAAPTAGSGFSPRNLASLTIGNSASVTLAQSGTGDRTVLELSSLSIANGGKLDLNNNDLILHHGALSDAWSLLATGYAGGHWNGSGITSSTASADLTHLTGLGLFSNNTGSGAFYTSFANQPVVPSDVLIRYTVYGDANLDGHVTTADYTCVDAGFLSHSTGWFNGDLNYDGVVNGSDYTLLDNGFNQQAAATLSVAAASSERGSTPPIDWLLTNTDSLDWYHKKRKQL